MTKQQEKQDILRRARETLLSGGRSIGRLDAGANALDRDALAQWSKLRKARQEPEEPPAAPTAPEPPFDWAAYIDQRIAAAIEKERDWLLNEMLPELVATLRDEASVELSLDVRRLNCELAELRALIGEARAMVRADRAARGIAGPVLDVPPKPAAPVN
jgi:hypothetical protein